MPRNFASVPKPDGIYWFAAKIVKNRLLVKNFIQHDAVKTFTAPVVQNILFIYCTRRYLANLIEAYPGSLFFYRYPSRTEPQVIDEKEMRNFMLVVSAQENGLIALNRVDHKFLVGQHVRVTGGVFQGLEGVVKRIKGDRRLIVSITGIVCVATSYIHPSLLVPVADETEG